MLKGRSYVPVGSVLLQKTSPNHGQRASGITGQYETLLQRYIVEHQYLVRSGVQLLTTASILNGQTTIAAVMLYTEELAHWHLSMLLLSPLFIARSSSLLFVWISPFVYHMHSYHLSVQPCHNPSICYTQIVSVHNSYMGN